MADLTKCKSVSDVQHALLDFASLHPDNEWIMAVGWHQEALSEKR